MSDGIYGAFSQIYDRMMEDFDYKQWFETLEKGLKQIGAEPKTCLEVGCGTGGLSAYLAKVYELVAMDQSQDMLAIAKTRPIEAQWIQGDLFTLDGEDKFDLIVLSTDVMHYLAPERRQEALGILVNHLEEDGLLVWDSRDAQAMRTLDGTLYQVDEEDLFAIYAYDILEPSTLVITVQAFYFEGGQWHRLKEEHPLHLIETVEDLGWEKVGLNLVAQKICYPRVDEAMEEDRRTLTIVKKGTQ